MDAPPTPQQDADARSPFRLSRQQWVTVASIVFVASSLTALWQFRAPYSWHEPYGPRSRAWWLKPIEWNIDAGLPDIVGNINAVEVIAAKVFVAGDNGLLAFSPDAGRTFFQLRYSPANRDFTLPPDAGYVEPQQEARIENDDPLRWLVPTLSAAQQPSLRERIAASAEEVTFASMSVGAPRQSQRLRFKNGSSASVKLPPPRILGSVESFSTEVTDCDELLPGEECNFFVAFAPKTPGIKNGILLFAGYSIVLSGVAEPPAAQPGAVPPSSPPASQPAPQVQPTVPRAPDLDALYCTGGAGCELMAGDGEAVFVSTNGLVWKTASSYQGTSLHGDAVSELQSRSNGSLGFVRDATVDSTNRRAWIVTRGGFLFRVDDFVDSAAGGSGAIGPLIPVTRAAAASLPGHSPASGAQYGRFLPPWYIFVLALCLLMSVPERAASQVRSAAKGPDAPAEEDRRLAEFIAERVAQNNLASRADVPQSGIGNQAIADKPLTPGEPDALGLGIIATGLAFFLRNEKTKPPLVIAINGRWGSGKSSLMNLLKSQMEAYGARPVWFNAWHHQKEDQLLAALLETVKKQAIPTLSQGAGWAFRSRLAWERLQRHWTQLALIVGAVALLWYVETNLSERLSIGSAISSWFSWTDDAPTKLAAERATAALEAARRLEESAKQTTDPEQLARFNAAIARFRDAATAPVTSRWFDRVFGPLEGSFLAIVAAVLAVFKTLSRGLRAFASNPASLLASDSGSTKPKDLEAQTSFRERFAGEFADVTRALGRNRRMLILIDDLDRCRPEKVREVLEAVNFLVSSGDCFIVLGMARDIVEHCVGLSFRRVVDTMPWDAFDLSKEEIARFIDHAKSSTLGSASDSRVQLAAKREAFARLFLDKLVQIEVSIPEPTPLQKRKLFETDEERQTRHATELRVAKWLRSIKGVSGVTVPAIQAAVVLLILVGGGFQAGRSIASTLERVFAEPPVQTAAAAPPTTLQPAPAPPADGTPPPGGTPAVRVAQAPVVEPRVVAGTSAMSAGWLAAWPFYGAFLAAFAFVSTALRRLPHQTVRDAKPFTNALNVWHPLVMTAGARNTPRTARRFQNRVRYLAMRQRALATDTPVALLERAVRSVLKTPARHPDPLLQLPERWPALPGFEDEVSQIADWLRLGIDGDSKLATVKQTGDGAEIKVKDEVVDADTLQALAVGSVHIPEPILVALAAIHEFDARLIDDPERFKTIVNGGPASAGGNLAPALSDALARHRVYWTHWENLTYYRRAYLRLCSEVDSAKAAHG